MLVLSLLLPNPSEDRVHGLVVGRPNWLQLVQQPPRLQAKLTRVAQAEAR